MANTDDLTTARNNYIAQLKDISVNPKPTYTVDGQTFKWTEYQKFLTEQIKTLEGLIASEDGIVEEHSRLFT